LHLNYLMKNLMIILLTAAALIMIFVPGCNEGTELAASTDINSEYDLINNHSGTLNFFITATELPGTVNIAYGKKGSQEDILSLVASIGELEIHKTGEQSGWKILSLSAGSFDLMELSNSIWSDLIASANPETGQYNQIRIYVSGATVKTSSGTYEAVVPSGKIKLMVPFTVHEDGTTEITIAFDPKASLKSTGNKKNPKYFLNPVLKVTSKVED